MANKIEKLDRLFSKYIRLREADHSNFVSCFTCGIIKHYNEMDCSHFILRGNDATRFDERNCRPCCIECNRFRNGMPEAFEEELRLELGDEEVDDLIALGRSIKKYSDDELDKLIKHYTLEVRRMGGTLFL